MLAAAAAIDERGCTRCIASVENRARGAPTSATVAPCVVDLPPGGRPSNDRPLHHRWIPPTVRCHNDHPRTVTPPSDFVRAFTAPRNGSGTLWMAANEGVGGRKKPEGKKLASSGSGSRSAATVAPARGHPPPPSLSHSSTLPSPSPSSLPPSLLPRRLCSVPSHRRYHRRRRPPHPCHSTSPHYCRRHSPPVCSRHCRHRDGGWARPGAPRPDISGEEQGPPQAGLRRRSLSMPVSFVLYVPPRHNKRRERAKQKKKNEGPPEHNCRYSTKAEKKNARERKNTRPHDPQASTPPPSPPRPHRLNG